MSNMIKSTIPMTTKAIAKKVESETLVFDNAIQRSYVWDKKRASLLIDSMLRNFPIPPFYAIKKADDNGNVKYDCIDGKQRCTTISMFRRNELPLVSLEPIELEDGTVVELDGKTYDTLEEELKDAFDSYNLVVYGFENISVDEIEEMMSRLNNGKPLTNVEITRIKAKDLETITELGNHAVFNNFSSSFVNGHKNEDAVVKTIMLFNGQHCLDNKVVRPIFESIEIDADTHDRVEDIFDVMHEGISMLKAEDHGDIAKKVLKATHFISLTTIADMIVADENIEDKGCTFADFCLNFFYGEDTSTNEDYNNACLSGSNHTENVEARKNALLEAYAEYNRDVNGFEEDEEDVVA